MKTQGCRLLVLVSLFAGFYVFRPSPVFADTVINSCQDLQNIYINPYGHYVLGQDIDCSGYPTYSPTQPQFLGSLDGRGYKISNVTLNIVDSNAGLFYVLGPYSTVSNLTLVNFNISGHDNIGALAGTAHQANIIHVVVRGSYITGHDNVGGLVGFADQSNISRSSAQGVIINGQVTAGGLAGLASDVRSPSHLISNSEASGLVRGLVAGGLAGRVKSMDVMNSYATADVEGPPNATLGGLVGMASGQSGFFSHISNAYAAGPVGKTAASGGVVGWADKFVVTNGAYWDMASTNQSSDAVPASMGRTSSQMRRQATFTGWNFNIWQIQEGVDYPYFEWEPRNYLYTCDDLQNLNATDLSGIYVLASDIDCSSISFIPLGVTNNSNSSWTKFTGTLNGNNHTIKGLNLNCSSSGMGCDSAPFGFIVEMDPPGVINNLTLDNAQISGNYDAGLVAYFNGSLIHHVLITNSTITALDTNDAGEAGAFAYRGSGFVIKSGIDNTYVEAGLAAGLIAEASNARINQCSVKGTIASSWRAGGLLGIQTSTRIINSYSRAHIQGKNAFTYSAAGLIADNGTQDPPVIINSYVAGPIDPGEPSGSGAGLTEGLVSSMNGTQNVNYSEYPVNSYWDTQATGQSADLLPNSTGKTTREMYLQSTYDGWDFKNIWRTDSGYEYPQLQWEPVKIKVMEDGRGSGTVTSNPAGFNCNTGRTDSTCEVSVPQGTRGSLIATPDAGSTFGGWENIPACGKNTSCTLTAVCDLVPLATFNLRADATVNIVLVDANNKQLNVSGTALVSGPNRSETIDFTAGGFFIYNLEDATYSLAVNVKGYQPLNVSGTIDASDQGQTINIRLQLTPMGLMAPKNQIRNVFAPPAFKPAMPKTPQPPALRPQRSR